MRKHLTNEQIDNRLGAVMNAFKEENATSVMNLNSVASLLESGNYSINQDAEISNRVSKSIKRLTGFVNRISDIVYKGTEEHSLNEQIDANIKFWQDLRETLNS
jgi:hypothetical protein